jgi:hypothetical protein
VLAFGILLFGMLQSTAPNVALAGLVPTPPAGTGTPVTVPAPNPLDYNAVSGAVISSQQFNSNLWKSYNDMNAIATALNTCAYSSGTGVTSVTATAPIMASIGACSPGNGTALTLSLGSGVPLSATYFTASNLQETYRWIATGSIAGHTMALDTDSTGSINGVPCEAARVTDFTIPLQLMCLDGNGNMGMIGGVTPSFVNARPAGTGYGVPWDANSPVNDANTHIESNIYLSGTVGATACTSPASLTFPRPFTGGTVPYVGLTVVGAMLTANLTSAPTNVGFSSQVCNPGFAAAPFSAYYFAEGH